MADEDLMTIDEEIMESIGEGDEQNTDEGTEEETTRADENADESASTASDQQSADEVGDGEQSRKPAGPQDLVDRDGNVVATGGKERRFYETAQREKGRAEGFQREVETLKGQLEAISGAGTLGTQYNLSPEEVTTGAQIISAYKENPIETIKYMLTQAQASGHNIDDLIAGGATDMDAIKQMINTSLAPLLDSHNEQVVTQENQQQAQQIYDKLMSDHPDAGIHEDTISRLMQQDNALTVEAAYFKLQNYYLQKNLDWTKDLATLQNELDTNNADRARVNTREQPPEGGVDQGNVTDTSQVADVNVSTSDIIKQAIADAGIT